MSDPETLKRTAASTALAFVEPGMRLGLGTGSTAKIFVDLLADRVRAGLSIVGVPTSEVTRRQAEALGVPLTTLDETPDLDLTIDGTDEFDADLNLIKGGGGALLREKIVAAASARMVVIADASKKVDKLGRFPLPVEVNTFGLEATRRAVAHVFEGLGRSVPITLRKKADGHVFVTDGGHMILDCLAGIIDDSRLLASRLHAVPGVVEHGLFVDMASIVVMASPEGVVTFARG